MAAKQQTEIQTHLTVKRRPEAIFLLSLPLLLTVFSIVFGCLMLLNSSLGKYATTILFIIAMSAVYMLGYARIVLHSWRRSLIIIAVVATLSGFLINLIPSVFFGFNILAVFHRSTVSSILILLVSVPSLCLSLFYIFGATPKAQDLSRYPIILLPIVVALAAFSLIIYRLIAQGAPLLSWHLITSSYIWHGWSTQIWVNNWPETVYYNVQQTGIGQYIEGTFLLMLLVSLISLPIGVGVGLYITQYSSGTVANIIKFVTNSLRAISVFALALVALSVVRSSVGTFLAPVLDGFYYNENGVRNAAQGSFIVASIFISMLVIPIIANATEEGIRSLPNDIIRRFFRYRRL